MKVSQIRNILLFVLLLLGGYTSHARISEHRAGQGLHIQRPGTADAAQIISDAFAILEVADVPQTTGSSGTYAKLSRTSPLHQSTATDAAISAGKLSRHIIYYKHWQHRQTCAAPPLFIAIRRLLI